MLSGAGTSHFRSITFVAVDDKIIAGFGDIDRTGYPDRLFVHVDYQKKGIVSRRRAGDDPFLLYLSLISL